MRATDSRLLPKLTGGSRQDKYVGVMGSMKVFGGKRHVSATHIRPIINHDEVYNHLLKALYVSLSLRFPNGGGVSGDSARQQGTRLICLTLDRAAERTARQMITQLERRMAPTRQHGPTSHHYTGRSWRSFLRMKRMMGCMWPPCRGRLAGPRRVTK